MVRVPVSSPLVPALASNGHALSYDRMRTAIAQCLRIDELKAVADQSVAMAAYYKQVKDDSSVTKFKQIRIRAYRRLGEIFAAVTPPKERGPYDGEGWSAYSLADRVALIRKHFKNDPTIKELSDSRIYNCLRLAAVPIETIERELRAGQTSVDAILGAPERDRREKYWASPEGKAEAARRAEEKTRWEKKQVEKQQQEAAQKAQEAAEAAAEDQVISSLLESYDAALGEVGFTMERRDRENMHQIVFLLKRDIYEILRKAAFESRITMQEVLRRGLVMWLAAHGHPIPDLGGKPPRPHGGDKSAGAPAAQ